MAQRMDGIKSSEKLLETASAVFAEKGYRQTTIAEICRRAGCNVASINYHFRSKDDLYAAVWRKAFDESLKVYPLDGGLPADAPAEEKLYSLINSSLHRILDEGRLGRSGQILLREMTERNEKLEPFIRGALEPLHLHTQQVIRTLLGPKASQEDVNLCELSVMHQCIAFSFAKARKKLPPFLRKLGADEIDKLAGHITQFSLAGIRSVRNHAENKKDDQIRVVEKI